MVFKAAASRHAPEAAITEGEILLLNVVAGDLLFQDEDGEILATENRKSAMEHYPAQRSLHGITPHDLTAFS